MICCGVLTLLEGWFNGIGVAAECLLKYNWYNDHQSAGGGL